MTTQKEHLTSIPERAVWVGSFVILATMVFSLLLPMLDHHWVERLPTHSHLQLDGSYGAIPPHHHPYEVPHEHVHGLQVKPGAPFVAVFNFDIGNGSGFGLSSEPLLSAQLPWLQIPAFIPSLRGSDLLFLVRLSKPPEPPPPRNIA